MANENAKMDENFKGVLLATSNSTSQVRRVLVDESTGYLLVSGSLSVGGATDNAAFTAGTTTGTPVMGFYHSTIDTVTDGRSAAIGMTSKRGMFVNLQTAAGVETGVAAAPLQVSLANTSSNATAVKVDGSAVTQPVSEADGVNVTLGAKADAKSTATDSTAVTVMQVLKQISASVQAPPSQAVTNAGTFAVQATPVTQVDTFMLGGVNIKEINAVTPLMGNGTTGTGSLRVTIASDNTAFAVNSTLSAETTKVIGVTRTADGAGNLLTSNSTTYTAKFGLDGNLLGTLGTAFSTAGKVDVKAADGDVFVRQTTGSNLHMVVDSGTVTTVSTVTNQSQEGGVAISLNAGAVDTGTRRVVQANGAGKTIVSKTGSASSSGNNTIVAAGTNKLKVFAFSLSTSSTTAITVKFQDGASGTDLWSVVLQAPTSVTTGANLAVSPPAWLFNTSAATLLNLNISAAQAVQWAVSYFDES